MYFHAGAFALAYTLLATPLLCAAQASLSTKKFEPQFFPGISKRVQVRYGPYQVPPMSQDNGMREWTEPRAAKPCKDCLITWFRADLEYVDGRPANVDTGLWLHHSVSTMSNKKALTCPTIQQGDLFFSCGNERSAFDLTANGTQHVGYHVGKDDNLVTLTELMNMKDEPQTAILTMTYEFVPANSLGFEQAFPLWMDVSGCTKVHELPLTATSGEITYDSKDWTSTKNYRIAANIGHLHDGGVNHLTLRNGKAICDSAAIYGDDAAFLNPAKPAARQHVSSMGECRNQGYLVPGDNLSVRALYDLDQHTPMVDADGTLEPVMGISWMWLVEDNNLPLADQVRWQAGQLAQNAKQHGVAYGVVFLLLFLVGGLTFWIGRRAGKKLRKRRAEMDKLDEEETYHLEPVANDYKD